MNSITKDKKEKRILFICSPFFGYYKHIINEFELQGYKVDYYNDRPSENNFIKGIIKIKRNIVDLLIKKYFENILEETRNKQYELVIIVNGKVFTDEMIRRLRATHKKARFVYYTWDTLSLYPNAKGLIAQFDKAYSFDTNDCEKMDKLELLPLFYTTPYEKIGEENVNESSNREYEIMSVCTAHPNRYKTMHELFPKLESKGIRVYSFMFLNILQYYYNRVFVPEFKGAKKNEFRFKSLSEQENSAILKKSNTVFDMQHNKQSGLTMRTIETLGAKRKMVTTNTNIKKYDFYNENNIFILGNNNLDDIEEFLYNKFVPISEDIYKKYSVHSWVKTIINEESNNYFK
ncbi:hypothetical protein [Clostridium lacusfryxellense]|uniref:hypothetical protein n=1 Tax=Clostridium lacusfryxellense TaxID=205328 RepID=UPI001C0CAC66|nr:hypothetical protein [Clostridium lacusfryxellense]MBU3111462.1 hypothetical protein [Clostridium lacusfryxellense]